MALKFNFKNSKKTLIEIKDSYWFTPFIIGLYPFLFYYSNNFASINSLSHLRFFILYFFGIPFLVFAFLYVAFKLSEKLKSYQSQILFVTIIMCVATLMSQAMYLTYKKKALVVILLISVLLSLKLHKNYKKLLILIFIMAVLPIFKNIIHFYDQYRHADWLEAPKDLVNLTFKKTPNIYLIQPDGYVSEPMMEGSLYNHKTDLYDWLRAKDYKLYDDFRSNYVASLASNSSMFAMKQHYYGGSFFNTIEVPRARELIVGENPVLSAFRRNGYKSYFVVQDEYFQQNKTDQAFDYYNIRQDEIPSFSNGNNVKKVVFDDLKLAMKADDSSQAKFFFIEKLLPHHVHFYAPENRLEAERNEYLENVDEVTEWLKITLNYIQEEDPDAIIIVLADHGGWVGIENYNDMFTTEEEDKIFSIYASLAAIKWNGHLVEGYDDELQSAVNLFRVLFSVLSENKTYLDNLEDDSSYNLHIGNPFYKTVYKVIDDQGRPVYEKH